MTLGTLLERLLKKRRRLQVPGQLHTLGAHELRRALVVHLLRTPGRANGRVHGEELARMEVTLSETTLAAAVALDGTARATRIARAKDPATHVTTLGALLDWLTDHNRIPSAMPVDELRESLVNALIYVCRARARAAAQQ